MTRARAKGLAIAVAGVGTDSPRRVWPSPRNRLARRQLQALGRPLGLVSVLLLAVAVILWIVSIPRIHPTAMTDFGLVSVLPVTFFLALACLLCGYVLSLRQRPLLWPVLGAYNVVLIVAVHGTPQMVYSEPRYTWIYKHFGIVDYILRHGTVNRQTL